MRLTLCRLRDNDGPAMAGVAQLVRAPDCGSGGRRFETGHSPHVFPEIVFSESGDSFIVVVMLSFAEGPRLSRTQ